MYIVLTLCLLYLIKVIQSQIRHIQIKYTKNFLTNVLNQNVNGTKREWFTTFAIGIANNLCLLRQYIWNTIKI